MNDHEVTRIATALNQMRPDWPVKQLTTLLRDDRMVNRPRRDAAVALAWVACEPNTASPYRVFENGPWWRAAAVDGTQTGGTAKTLSWTQGDPRETCGICDMRRDDCESRAATNGHDFLARTKCLPPMDPPNWMDGRQRACRQGPPDDGCQLDAGHDGQHQPAYMADHAQPTTHADDEQEAAT